MIPRFLKRLGFERAFEEVRLRPFFAKATKGFGGQAQGNSTIFLFQKFPLFTRNFRSNLAIYNRKGYEMFRKVKRGCVKLRGGEGNLTQPHVTSSNIT